MMDVVAPGARVVIRDAEWLVRKVDATSTGGYAIHSLPDTFTKLFLHKRLRGWLIVYSLERATHPEGAYHERQPPQVSCYTGCLNTMVSWPAIRPGRQARDHPCRTDQRHRRQQEHAIAPYRCESARRHPTRKPCQTLCAVVQQRPYPRGSIFSPYADVLLRHLALQTLVLVMDGSGVGRGCTALMIHVIDKGRALPLAWRVRQAPQGHCPEELHIALVELISGLIPVGTQVVLLGDGACDGTRLQQPLQDAGWAYACRTATSTVASWEGETFRLDALGACLKPGRLIE